MFSRKINVSPTLPMDGEWRKVTEFAKIRLHAAFCPSETNGEDKECIPKNMSFLYFGNSKEVIPMLQDFLYNLSHHCVIIHDFYLLSY